eukprot:scaffold52113_cov38-Phaeocystis_antarctica.AAC.1
MRLLHGLGNSALGRAEPGWACSRSRARLSCAIGTDAHHDRWTQIQSREGSLQRRERLRGSGWISVHLAPHVQAQGWSGEGCAIPSARAGSRHQDATCQGA